MKSMNARAKEKDDGARQSIIGSGHLFYLKGALARVEDGTHHPRDAIIPNYFSISGKRKERVI